MDEESTRLGMEDVNRTEQVTIEEVSASENPFGPQYFWKYDIKYKRKIRVYIKKFRTVTQLLLIPLAWLLLIVGACISILFAIWGGTYLMVLPKCGTCKEMLAHVDAGPDVYYQTDPRPSAPYDEYLYDVQDNQSFYYPLLQNRSWNDFIFTWSDNLTDLPPTSNVGEKCLPTICAQSPSYIMWGTCWENPSGPFSILVCYHVSCIIDSISSNSLYICITRFTMGRYIRKPSLVVIFPGIYFFTLHIQYFI